MSEDLNVEKIESKEKDDYLNFKDDFKKFEFYFIILVFLLFIIVSLIR